MSEAIHVLLDGAPRDVNLEHIREHILGTENVIGLHDLHVWSMSSGMPVTSAHVVYMHLRHDREQRRKDEQ